jgi:ribosomal protein S12 methylthiotransferase accessory factor
VTNPFAGAAPLELPRRAPKAPGSWDRCVPLDVTVANIPELRRLYGITRVGDTTYLDRTNIPTFCAVVPDSPDLLSVYNGKGTTPQSSMVSAVMEAVERQVAARLSLPSVPMRVRDVLEFVDLRSAGLREDALELITPCVAATELLSGTVVPMPLALVQCPWFGEKLFDITSSNGIASGNTIVEALYHALTEVIERHVWSLFYIRSQLVPRFYLGSAASDVARAREIVAPTGDAGLDKLIERICGAPLSLRILALEEATLPMVALAIAAENGAEPPMAHSGLGCSLSSVHAIERAITECVQSRAVDIQAAREDIMRADAPEGVFGNHARRQRALPHGRWYFDLPSPAVTLGELAENMSDDVALDLSRLLRSLADYGVENVYAVNLPAQAQYVVRAIVPKCERTTVDGTIGSFGRREFNPFYVQN